MAAKEGLKWQERLPEHPLFQELSYPDDRTSSRINEYSQERATKNILIENDGEIFVWNSGEKSLLTANLKNLHFENERSDEFQVSGKFSIIMTKLVVGLVRCDWLIVLPTKGAFD